MTLPSERDNPGRTQFNTPTLALISAFALACCAPTWAPWLRWIATPVVVVVLVLVIYLVTGALLLPVSLR